MPRKSDFAEYHLKYRDDTGSHTLHFSMASRAMAAYGLLRDNPKVQTAAWFSAGGYCFASFTREPAQGVLPL